MKNYPLPDIKALVETAQTVCVVVPKLDVDSGAAALALAMLLEKVGKSVTVLASAEPDSSFDKIEAKEKIITNFSQSKNFTITLNYPLDKIERVSYNDDEGKGNIVVEIKPDAQKLSATDLAFSEAGDSFDLGVMLGDETVFSEAQKLTPQGKWLHVSPTPAAKPWATVTLVDQDAPFSEIFAFLLPQLDLALTPAAGKNLLIGLRWSTQSFSVNVNPETFEAGAACLLATQAELVKEAQSLPNTAPTSNAWVPVGMDTVETIAKPLESKEGGTKNGTEEPLMESPPIFKGSTTPRS